MAMVGTDNSSSQAERLTAQNSRLGLTVGRQLILFYLHQINQVSSHNAV